MDGIYGTIKTEKVKEWVLEANQTIAKLAVQFERHGGAERQKELVKLIKAKLAANKCQTAADYSQLAELVNLGELDEFTLMSATIEQDKWTKHLRGDLFILANYANGFIPRVEEPTRKQLLNLQYWVENTDIFADERE
jgi:hypothetical protein